MLFVYLWWKRTSNTKLWLTDRYVILDRGVRTLKRIQIPYEDIDSIVLHEPKSYQGNDYRWFTITSGHDPRIRIREGGIFKPERIQQIIEKRQQMLDV